MKMVKSLLLGTAAGLVAMTGAQAADLPVKAKPVQYVKICSLYGAGFYYIPGTDTCIKVGGFVRAEVNFNAGGSYSVQFANRDQPSHTAVNTGAAALASPLDARSQTAYGTLRAYVYMSATSNNSVAVRPTATGASAYTRCMPLLASSSGPASPLVKPGRSSTSTVSLIRTSRTSGRRTTAATASICSPIRRSSATVCQRRSRWKTTTGHPWVMPRI